MFFKKKGSLELSVNAIVVIVIAITMLGLGMAFLRGMFSKGLTQVGEQFSALEQQRINTVLEDCNEELCMEKRKVDISKNELKDVFIALYNKFDCDIDAVQIKIGGIDGGSDNFDSTACQIIGSDGTCSDIILQTLKEKEVISKQKEPVIVRIKAKNTAKNTVYSFPIEVDGSCTYSGTNFPIQKKKTIEINVVG